MKAKVKKQFKRIKDAMLLHGIYSEADDIVIEQAAACLDSIEENKADDYDKHKQLVLFMKYAYQLGLTPVARRNLGLDIKKAEVKENPFKLKKIG